jgi:hypothetical protein
MILHLLKRPLRGGAKRVSLSWQELEQQVRYARKAAYLIMKPFVQADQLTTSWLLTKLAANTPTKASVGNQTLSLWAERGLLRYTRHGRPAVDSAAALLIARMVDTRERNWLPSFIEEAEPQWWCWRQDGPSDPVHICPVPLPESLPAGTLLWTPWTGASLEHPWLPIGQLGATRWAHITRSRDRGHWIWKLRWADLERWDQEIARLSFPTPPGPERGGDEIVQEIFQAQAKLSLFRLALSSERLGRNT